jgi:hypothetical protein
MTPIGRPLANIHVQQWAMPSGGAAKAFGSDALRSKNGNARGAIVTPSVVPVEDKQHGRPSLAHTPAFFLSVRLNFAFSVP